MVALGVALGVLLTALAKVASFAASSPRLKVEHIVKTFNPGTINEVRALRDVTVHLPPGSFVIIIGTNGSGKSTLLKVLFGFLPPRIPFFWA